jgi:prepilin-type N-terminal cleavage/methylation domain-containing protein
MKNKQGFTLIELLVVIAIIGILSSIVLASLNSARGKGANAAVKSNLANVRAQAEIFYDNQVPNTYLGLCADPNVAAAVTAANTAGSGSAKCFGDGNGWVISSELKVAEQTTLTHYCVDSAGKSKSITTAQDTAISSATTLCPA